MHSYDLKHNATALIVGYERPGGGPAKILFLQPGQTLIEKSDGMSVIHAIEGRVVVNGETISSSGLPSFPPAIAINPGLEISLQAEYPVVCRLCNSQ